MGGRPGPCLRSPRPPASLLPLHLCNSCPTLGPGQPPPGVPIPNSLNPQRTWQPWAPRSQASNPRGSVVRQQTRRGWEAGSGGPLRQRRGTSWSSGSPSVHSAGMLGSFSTSYPYRKPHYLVTGWGMEASVPAPGPTSSSVLRGGRGQVLLHSTASPPHPASPYTYCAVPTGKTHGHGE